MKFRTKTSVWLLSVVLVGALGIAIWVTGCATIMHGTSQDVSITSTPSGASVKVDAMSYGKTPVVVNLSRGNAHVVKIDLAGYEPFEMAIKKNLSGWVWGNIIFGGLIGLAVDAISGGMYNLTPDQVAAELSKEGVGFLYEEDAIYITVVLKPDPSWERIANLKPLRAE